MALARMQCITKSYGGPNVLEEVSIDLEPGEVHVLAGENGAGKSTLIRILGGAVRSFRGSLELDGKPVRFHSPADAARKGVAVIHQELSIIPSLSVADNLLLGAEPIAAGGFRRPRAARETAEKLLETVELDIPADALAADLPISVCQLLEVAKALRSDARVIVMDEPTSALNAQEAAHLFRIIQRLKAEGRAIVYISHKMDEIERLADRISVLRDGRLIGTYPASEVSADDLIGLMVGDKRAFSHESAVAKPGEPRLSLQNVDFSLGERLLVRNLGFEVRAGEIVGLAGLQGSGASAVLEGLFGARGRMTQGEVRVNGLPYAPTSPRVAIGRGIAFLTNDRKATGLVLPLSVAQNTTLVALNRFCRQGWRSGTEEAKAAREQIEALNIKTESPDTPVAELSGGNQQKVALAKWCLPDPTVLLLDEPTRGIDIGAKREIYRLIEAWKTEGKAILLITTELPELLMLCDRILVMHRGSVVREFDREEATAEKVIEAAMAREAA